MNVNFLYPVVHDLTEAEYSVGCCNPSFNCNSTGCFSIEDLIYPESEPVSIPMSEKKDPKRQRNGFFGRSRSRSWAPSHSLVDDRNDNDPHHDRQLKFEDVYVLTRQAHRGKTATIWESVHKATGNRFATKVIDRRNLSSREDRAVLQEAAVLQQIEQLAPGTIHLIDLFDEGTHMYMVTDFAAGGDLLNRIHKKGPLTEEQAQKLARSILEGIKHVHDRNICHRNLRPENILLEGSDDALAIIADYGAAVQVAHDADGDRFLLTERCGANAFTAPEILQRHPYDTQADMWSIGVILYYAMAGFKPFDDPNSKLLFQKIVKADYTFNPNVWHKFSRSAKRFISSLLHTDPQVRMTANEALQHPWISEMEAESKTENEVPLPSKRFKGKRLSKVWKAFSRPGKKQKDGGEDDTHSMTSRTVSVVSSDPPGDSNKLYS